MDTRTGLALFDLDNTLLAGDSDYLWGEFLVDIGALDADTHRARNEEYYRQYQANTLDIYEFLEYQLAPMAAFARSELEAWRRAFVEQRIEPLITGEALGLVEHHREQGHELGIVTATNRFITAPIAALFGVADLIAIELEEQGGRYTGRPAGVVSSGPGKVERVRQHYGDDVFAARETWFYSDSVRDVPLLAAVDHPVVVDGDDALLAHAATAGWPSISLHSG